MNTYMRLGWPKYFQGRLVDLGLVAVFFGVPTSRALVNVGLALLLLGVFLGGGYGTVLERLRTYRLFLPTVLIFILVAAGTAWGIGTEDVMALHLALYAKLLPFLLVFVGVDSRVRIRYCWTAFSSGCFLMVFILYYRYMALRLGLPAPPAADASAFSVLRNYAVQSLLTAYCCLVLTESWQQASSRGIRWLIGTAQLVCLSSLLFLLESKAGLIGLLLVLLLFSFTRSLRAGLFSCVGVLILLALAFKYSPALAEKLASLASDLSALVSGEQYERHSSGGYRLAMWSASIDMMAQSWWYGHGTGSYAALSPQFFNSAECAVACVHPHNQWLFFGVEYGLLGVAVISFLIYRMATLGAAAKGSLRLFIWGLTVLFVVDAMFNGPLWLPGERVFFFSMFALLAAQLQLTSAVARDQRAQFLLDDTRH